MPMEESTPNVSSSSRLTRLSTLIFQRTAQIAEYLKLKGLGESSFDANGLAELPIAKEDAEVQKARVELIDATKELRDLVVGARETLRYLAWDHNDTLSLHAVYHYKIAHAFPLDGTITYTELAEKTNMTEANIRRLVRHAMTNNIFREVANAKNTIEHTAASRLLREDTQLQCWVGLHTEDLWGVTTKTVPALEKWPRSEEFRETALQIEHGFTDSWFEYLGKRPDNLKRFGVAMASFSSGEGFEIEYLAEHPVWASIGNGKVVDVGGSIGFACVTLARAYPDLSFVVQDLPKVVDGAHEKIPESLRDKIKFVAHDFLTEQPVKDADVYLFRWIFHNWSDKYAVEILRNHIPALKKGAKIIVNDGVLPEPGVLSRWDEKLMRTIDLVMLTTVNAREREVDDWRSLFYRADPRFRFLGASKPKESKMWAIEAVWDPHGELSEKDAAPGALLGNTPDGAAA
ncbi:hypothetical protein W97_03162 [Coniosporium apollinis CBS 100218]|uniref:O-methyltransferase C-terminal domain-containing protein n=1 Tax=Coniosporium apollinis (strain CBS 100218) TaxID=1168221 RepID=R7YQ37_CONA1|nr:uncharacterized protein W97_03162 [Coniosporium apollinis CBS 100218]EON63934.1 hypothetical protein W97_03162 [Coniosporium apollinis CBS 100218]